MSLVDYASSSEDEEVEAEEELQHYKQDQRRVEKEKPDERAADATVPPQLPQSQQKSSSLHPTHRQPDISIPSNAPSMEKIPDASILLSSPSFSQWQHSVTDRSSRIASTVTEMASRKREPNGSAFINPPNKHARRNLSNSRNIPDTISDTFIPPQLKGRSNVVTEDLRKLFVNQHREPSG